MQQAKGCTAVGSPVAVQVAGCKGRALLFPGLGQGGPSPSSSAKVEAKGLAIGPFFRPRFGQEGYSPAGHSSVDRRR